MDNLDVARVFKQIADLLEIKGANPFKVRAYRNTADLVGETAEQIADLSDTDLRTIPGIGKDLAAKLRELVDCGTLAYFEELLQELPRTLLDLLELQGVGPKTVGRLYHEIGVASIEQLEDAARSGRIRSLDGFGARKERLLLRAIEDHCQSTTQSS